MSILPSLGGLFQPAKPASIGLPDEPDALTDMPKARKRLFDQTLKAAQSLEPLANARHTLKLVDVKYAGPENFSLKDQKYAVMTGGTLGRPLKGTFQLSDNATGQVLDQKRMTLASVPYRTDRGTFIHNGTEYAVRNQMRLLPGVFSRVKGNGELESHVNVLPGKGLSHRYFLDPDKGVFYIRVAQSKTPLVSLLDSMGVSYHQMQEAWGPELAAANIAHKDPADVKKLAGKFLRRIPENQTDEHTTKQLLEAFNAMELDPEVTRRTLGHPFTNVGPETILRTTQKLIQLQNGETEPDDRDHLAYQRVMAPEDLFSERVSRDAGNVRRQLLFKASQRGHLQGLGSRPFQKQLNSVILTSGVGTGLEETSPLELLDKMSTITSLGVGGLPSTTAIPDESRSVQPSHFGFIDPLKTPESEAAGVILNIAGQARRRTDGQLAKQFKNIQTGQLEWKTPQDVADSAIAFPGELSKPGKRVVALRNGKLQYVPKSEIQYELPHFEHAFGDISNLVPMKSALKGQRAVMGARMLTQALPLENPEAPWVQSAVPGTNSQKSYDEHFGSFMGAIRSAKGGRVTSVTPEGITVQHDDGTSQIYETYDSFPFNRRSRLHNTPMVQPGQRIEPDGLLAKSNFTDDKGTIAIGKNAYVGFMPHGAGTYEDAQLISESFSKKLRSEHLYQHEATWNDPLDKKGKAPYISLYPSKFSRKQLDTIDDDGVVKPGTVVEYGHPLVLLAKGKENVQSKVHRKGQPAHSDASLTWDYNSPGVVRDVVKTDNGPMVTVTSMRSTQEADKLADRFGAKGVIGKILPDALMPQDSTGRPFDMLLNPAGIPSRLNPVKIHEATLGKIAEQTGQPYKIEDFSNIDDLRTFVEQEARKHGIPDTETVYDPGTNRHIPGVKTGVQWIMKLHHIAEDKEQGRGAAGGYTLSGVPAKGGEGESSKKLSLGETNALLSHGALSVLRDSKLLKGQRNEPFWLSFMQGNRPVEPNIPPVYEKFINELKASGINPVRDGASLHVMALTNKDVDQLSGDRELLNGHTVNFDGDLTPVHGGLFDPALTGGHNGTRWSHIKLADPMPSPAMEEPIRKLLGITKNKFEGILSGTEAVGQYGSGPQALKKALEAINVDKELLLARMQIKSGRKTARDQAVRKLGYLKAAKALGIHPADWVLDKAPILPPVFRPVAKISDSGQPIISDANYLYKEMIDANTTLGKLKGIVGDNVGQERLALYNSFKAVTGLGDPSHPKLVEKGIKGLLAGIWGSSPKFGTVQSRLLSTPVDIVGRATVQPNSDLDMDEVGLPEERAWTVYKNFIVRRLKRQGMPLTRALQEHKDQTPMARKALLDELETRPVVYSRAPIHHKYGIMAAWPRLVKGNSLHISPLVTVGFGADFDGDQMNYHVPVSDAEVADAVERMLPSKNLISPADFRTPMFMPRHEMLGGLFESTRSDVKGRHFVFHTKADALRAYAKGELTVHDTVEIRT